jgi:hypothetical protein
MREGNLENVAKIIKNRQERLIKKIHSSLKGVKPIGAVKIDPLEKVYHIEQSGYLEDPTELIQEFGYDTTAKFLNDYWKLRSRYNA